MSMTIFQRVEYYGDNNDNDSDDDDDDADDNDEYDGGSDDDCVDPKKLIYFKNVNFLNGCSPVTIFLYQLTPVSF